MHVKENKYQTVVTCPELKTQVARSRPICECANKMDLKVNKLIECRLGDLAKNRNQFKHSVHTKGERILKHISDITGLYFSLRIYNVCFMCSMCMH
jgi:hypothetical protein